MPADPFDRAVAREARYEQAIRGTTLSDVAYGALSLALHLLLVRDDTWWLRAHAVAIALLALGTFVRWVHDEKLGRRPVVTRWREVVVVRRPGPKL